MLPSLWIKIGSTCKSRRKSQQCETDLPSISGTSVTLESPGRFKWFVILGNFHPLAPYPSFPSEANPPKLLPKQSDISDVHCCQRGSRSETTTHCLLLNLRRGVPWACQPRPLPAGLKAGPHLQLSDSALESNRGHQRLLRMANTEQPGNE